MKNKFLKNFHVGVIGLARSGIAAANLAAQMGAKVLVSEVRPKEKCLKDIGMLEKGIQTEFEHHSDKLFKMDLIIKSPGVPNNIEIFKKIDTKKVSIWGEIEFASRIINCKQIIAITGTNGKTTTTALTGEVFKATKEKTVVAGNIGAPLAAITDKIDPDTNVVLELSSYQLEDSFSFHPHICAVLNITPDHMEHHHSMENYINAKAKIFQNQSLKDYCVLNYDDSECRKLAKRCNGNVIFFSRKKKLENGVFFNKNKIYLKFVKESAEININLKIPGMHNIENVLAVVAIAYAAKIKPEIIEKVINNFTGVEHRIELCGEINGVKYYNDSKATNVDSTRVALESFEQPIWLILGGRDKGSPYTPLNNLIKNKVKGILLIGEAAPVIKKAYEGLTKIYNCKTIETAVKTAKSLSQKGEIVLLSPACASFDQFKDYEDRGRQFKKIVERFAK